ncbi:DNA gyrase subunit A [Helicovermis profundi]|uniref:DNA gyrase subunit A n=2 Tax=Helicovermis profundi TaxID=3065157 RepID=A0AAU9EKZ8_9FIRM|nr:DNA gyrase subunit A [Clostridia bacterium S502]
MAKIEKQRITETLEKNYMPYAMSVIVSRAIPEIDGFKPSHRKLLYTMFKMKLITSNKTKSANVVGQTMKLNPHGDQAIYATMVRLTRGHDALLHPYVDSKGNFGKTTSRDMKFAASRYTEVKLDSICSEIFKDIEKNTVEFVDNYDGELKEPTLLPTTFPNILVSPNKGIAVGMASSFCSFNLEEICLSTIEYIKNPNFDIMTTLKGPDFSTGASLIYNEEDIRKIYDTGLGSFKLRSKYKYVKKENCLEIYEIPYTTTTEAIIDKIVELVKNGKVKEISDIRDETDLGGLKITIDLKRNVNPDEFMIKLYRYTPLEDTFSCNFNLLIESRPKVLGVKNILNEWLKFRTKSIKGQVSFDIKNLSDKLHLLYGLKTVVLDIDKAISIIRKTESDDKVVPNLINYFKIDEIQANYVADIKLRNLNKNYVLKRISEIAELEAEIKDLNDILQNKNRINKIIISDLKRVIKKHKRPRRTEIVGHDTIDIHTPKNEIDDYNLKVFFTAHSYLKKISLVSLRASNNQKLKQDDYIVQEFESSNKSDILFFSNECNCYKSKLYELPDHKASSLGVYVPNVHDMNESEKAIFTVVTNNYEGHLLFIFENGKIARVPLKSYETKTNRKRLVKAYSNDSKLIRILYIKEDIDIVLSRSFKGIEYHIMLVNTSLIPEKATKSTKGVQVLRLKKGSKLSKVFLKDEIVLEEIDHYRQKKIPMAGKSIDSMTIMMSKLVL